jgi:DNA mismatch endonuclease (patch repair protein)
MADVVTPAVRSRMMAGIRSTNTRPEMAIRKALHRRGFRYRLHAAGVPGRPDMVFPRYRAAVFVNGCFWHGHDCRFFRLPGTRTEFWRAKIARNRRRDADVAAMLAKAGWRQLTVWECTVRGKGTDAAEKTAGRIARWLRSRKRRLEMRGD